MGQILVNVGEISGMRLGGTGLSQHCRNVWDGDGWDRSWLILIECLRSGWVGQFLVHMDEMSGVTMGATVLAKCE